MAEVVVREVAQPAKVKRRHYGSFLSLLLFVFVPTILTAFYMWNVARPQYASHTAFSVRSAQTSPALELLGGISQIASSDTVDSEILYDFIRSQQLVASIDEAMDLRAIYECPEGTDDIVYCLKPGATIEDLVAYWNRFVRISYDGGAGLIDMEVRAFDPLAAREIAAEIFGQSSVMINALSDAAREDATKYAHDQVDYAVARLKDARRVLAEFRNANRIIDPSADIQGQMGVISSLQEQLTQALIDRGLLELSAPATDPRLDQLDRKIAVIEKQIEIQRGNFGFGGESSNGAFAQLMGQFEELTVEVEFAQESYLQALAALDNAQAEAERQSRYLAAHVKPTLAERAEYPQRVLLTGLVAFFSFMIWVICVLVYYSLRDRK